MRTKQQEYLSKKVLSTGLTVVEIAKMTGIQKTRAWRVIATDTEMKVSEYIAFIKLLRAKQLLTVEVNFFLTGAE